jgi:hypothetical protein
MDLQTRKLNLITYLAQIQDEVLFEKLERLILKREKEQSSDLKPFTIEEFLNRIEKLNWISKTEDSKVRKNWRKYLQIGK